MFFLRGELRLGLRRALTCFAAGAMIFVAAEELIPGMSAEEHFSIGAGSFAQGFSLMMALG